MKPAFAISLLFAISFFVVVLGVANQDVLNYAPVFEDVVPLANMRVEEGQPRFYDPCYNIPPDASVCGSYCSSYGYNGGVCISYACYCLLY